MITLLKETPLKGFLIPEGTKTWLVTCDVCGKSKEQTETYYKYGFGASGYPFYTGLSTGIFGAYNRRTLMFCSSHKDAEIVAKVLELI